jgi:hypothetical protein
LLATRLPRERDRRDHPNGNDIGPDILDFHKRALAAEHRRHMEAKQVRDGGRDGGRDGDCKGKDDLKPPVSGLRRKGTCNYLITTAVELSSNCNVYFPGGLGTSIRGLYIVGH